MPLDPNAIAEGRQLIPVITGPTAVGKTSLSLNVAETIGAEIISADSRQAYRRLDIGTAKPTAAERARVPHHFIDERELDEPFSAGMFARDASSRIREVLGRGRVPLVVGGATLYLHALLYGLAEVPAVPPDVRTALEARLAEEGAEVLYDELRRLDPDAAATLDATKTQRLVRALEVFYATGQPLSSFQGRHEAPDFAFRVVVMERDRAELYARINRRAEAMLEAGLVEEVRGLLADGVDPSLNPLRTIGYREPIRFLRGEIEESEMVRLLKRNTRRYAKRQLTWLRRYPDFTWHMADSIDASTLAHFFDLQ